MGRPDHLNKKFISGTNNITFAALQTGNTIQIDLQDPIYKDGYKLVEAPMLGMEHQRGIASTIRQLLGDIVFLG